MSDQSAMPEPDENKPADRLNGPERPETPQPHAGAGKRARQRRFLQAFAECGSVSKAAKRTGCDRRCHYRWIATDPKYRQRFARAVEMAGGALEDEAIRRATEGVLRPVYQGGKFVGPVREYSDRLLELLLRAWLPHKFANRNHIEHAGEIAGSAAVHVYLPDNSRVQDGPSIESDEGDAPEIDSG